MIFVVTLMVILTSSPMLAMVLVAAKYAKGAVLRRRIVMSGGGLRGRGLPRAAGAGVPRAFNILGTGTHDIRLFKVKYQRW